MAHQQECHNTHLLCSLEEEKEADCCSQTNHFLQQLHILFRAASTVLNILLPAV